MKYIFGGEEVKAWKFLTPSFQVIQKRFPALLKVHVQLFQFSLDVWEAKEGIVKLCKRTKENEDGKTCDKRDNNMFEQIFPQDKSHK